VEKWAGSGVGGILKKGFSCPLFHLQTSMLLIISDIHG
jgi:hypothetical protein